MCMLSFVVEEVEGIEHIDCYLTAYLPDVGRSARSLLVLEAYRDVLRSSVKYQLHSMEICTRIRVIQEGFGHIFLDVCCTTVPKAGTR